MGALRSFARIIDRQTFAVLTLSLLATAVCIRLGIQLQLPEGLIAIAIVFPLGFTINLAFARREKVLESYAALKGLTLSMYLSHRDWLVPRQPAVLAEVRTLSTELLAAASDYLGHADPGPPELRRFYGALSRLSETTESLREEGVAASDASRVNQYLSNMAVEFERMRNIRLYRTPTSLRAYAQVFLNLLPVLFAPHFAYLAARHSAPLGYLMAALYSVILVSLDNVQEALENPFDQVGEDDVKLDAAAQYQLVTEALLAEEERRLLPAAAAIEAA